MMKNKILPWFVITLTFLTSISCIAECNNEFIDKLESPSGKYVAFSFLRDCGATTDFSPQVTIMKKSIFNKTANLKNRAGNVFIGNKSKNISIEWIEDDVLLIKHSCNSKNTFNQKTELLGVKIQYEKINVSEESKQKSDA